MQAIALGAPFNMKVAERVSTTDAGRPLRIVGPRATS